MIDRSTGAAIAAYEHDFLIKVAPLLSGIILLNLKNFTRLLSIPQMGEGVLSLKEDPVTFRTAISARIRQGDQGAAIDDDGAGGAVEVDLALALGDAAARVPATATEGSNR
ncbi:hypothetical protein MEX01_46320 [Methylorubrum extorquens]|uniref:hypothetical protein n=1 Tax=Methylorubrum extorquens TaxID=408 RepID=UPI0011727AA2|nr:hypothetical protein [Methylorubrum extorquens]GEL44041.1 hypothetical protein MEX01_46320 [Methylorubrum extorquens]